MNAPTFEPNGFARERVKSRMLRRAAELWGYVATDMDSFDPLVLLLLEACAVEFEKIEAEISTSRTRLLDRLAQVMHPGLDGAKPAFGIAQVRPAEAYSQVYPTTQLSSKRAVGGRYDGSNAITDPPYFFSPVGSYPIVDGAVRYLATSQVLFRIEEGYQKVPVAQSSLPQPALPYQSLWLGLELADAISSPEGLVFFFGSVMEADQTTWQQALPLSRWRLGDQGLTVKPGRPEDESATISPLEAEFNPVHRLEKQILALYTHQFMTVEAAPSFQSASVQRQAYPLDFTQRFAERDLRGMRDALWWIEVQLPHLTSPDELADLICGINCFPVLNRRLHRLTYRLQPNLNIIPLESDAPFLMVREVRTSEGQRLAPVALDNQSEVNGGTYSIQTAVSRFDNRNARQFLTSLQELVRDESASFAALGEDFLSSIIRELNQTLARLEAKVEQKTVRQDPIPYLVIKPQQPGETVFIEYWTSGGEAANRLPAGSRLSPHTDPSLRKDGACLMTRTGGGRARPNEAQKINQYKRTLLSRTRIVTLEDVRIACLAELGNEVWAVQIERAFRVGSGPFNGFQRCIRVTLTPNPESDLTAQEWTQRTDQLRVNLESQSVGSIPYEIVVTHL